MATVSLQWIFLVRQFYIDISGVWEDGYRQRETEREANGKGEIMKR
jgi:hypothetical protein